MSQSQPNDQDRIRELEGEIARLREALQKAESHKREALMRLAAGFSHDVNNFLTPVLAYSTMIKEDLPPGHLAVEFADEIIQAADKAQQLIKLMQDVRAKGHLSGVMAVNDTVSSAIGEFRPQLAANIDLALQFDPAIGDAQGDGVAMRRALREIFDNAANSMPVGGSLTVSTRIADLAKLTPMDGDVAPPGRYYVVSVRDQGTGMSEDVRSSMYEPYFTTRPHGQAKGLGLSIARGLVRKCDGFLNCISAIGAGTTFEIYLSPLARG